MVYGVKQTQFQFQMFFWLSKLASPYKWNYESLPGRDVLRNRWNNIYYKVHIGIKYLFPFKSEGMKEGEGNLGAFGFCWDGSQMLAEHLNLSAVEHCHR